jgi:hypothetical protein
MSHSAYPSLYQINTRVWIRRLSDKYGRRINLDTIPDSELDQLSQLGFDWVWLLSVWQTGAASQQVSRSHSEWLHEYQTALPDLQDSDIGGSGFAITAYSVHRDLGGDPALARLREQLHQRGIRVMLDFVPNHTGLDHPWLEEHPDYFITGTPQTLAEKPSNYTQVSSGGATLILAHGRDPYFPGWPDTLQLDYGNPDLQTAMHAQLRKIAQQCDGLRCDMAMLILPDVFERTWERRPAEFWPAAIQEVRGLHPEFLFLAEVYWDLEWQLQQQGFNYTYDKRLYDRLRDLQARPVSLHLRAELSFQNKLVRFLENHDEPRAAVTFAPGIHEAAAVVTYLCPGMRFFHQGQLEGYRRRVPAHLVRGLVEPIEPTLQEFYLRLLGVLKNPVVREGQWQQLECAAAWDGNWTNDCFLAYVWQLPGYAPLLILVNYAPHQSQCRIPWPLPAAEAAAAAEWYWRDMLGDCPPELVRREWITCGILWDAGPWQVAALAVTSDQKPPLALSDTDGPSRRATAEH